MNRRLLALLAATSLISAWYIWQDGGLPFLPQLGYSDAMTPAPAPSSPDAAAANGEPARNPLRDLTASQLAEIAARPLFNPTRAPRPPEQPVVETPPTETPTPQQPGINAADYELLAIAGGKGGRVAVVRFAPQNRVYHLRAGQFIEKLQVEQVGDRSVTLGRDGNSFEIALFKGAPVAPSAPPSDADTAPVDQGDGQVSPDAGQDGTDAPQQ